MPVAEDAHAIPGAEPEQNETDDDHLVSLSQPLGLKPGMTIPFRHACWMTTFFVSDSDNLVFDEPPVDRSDAGLGGVQSKHLLARHNRLVSVRTLNGVVGKLDRAQGHEIVLEPEPNCS